jgi:hypothetical protein
MKITISKLLDSFGSQWKGFHPHPLTPSPINGEGEQYCTHELAIRCKSSLISTVKTNKIRQA